MINAINAADFYKTSHKFCYPEGTEDIVANFTARSDKLFKGAAGFDKKVVFFGLQGVCQTLFQELWNKSFFNIPKITAVSKYVRRVSTSIGPEYAEAAHIEALHDLGYLPIEIRAVAEGSRVNIGVPMFTVRVSKKHRKDRKKFGWLVTYLETQLSSEMWKKITVATIAYEYRRVLEAFAIATGSSLDFVNWQGHDFSARGMTGIHDAAENGSAHLLSFLGTDTVSAIDYLEDYYNAGDTFVGGSVVATEHSVSCLNIAQNNPDLKGDLNMHAEQIYLEEMLEKYPSGVLSYVADTNDYFGVLTEILPNLKEKILSRVPNAIGLAKLVIRPDSGDPYEIVCGDTKAPVFSAEWKGSLQILWETFGGTINEAGYKVLNPRVGLIYGDSITLERAQKILEGMKKLGFASENIVFGIGSFTYNYVTRDTFGHAYKATSAIVDGNDFSMQKNPKTGDGVKKSAKGLIRVNKVGNDFVLQDGCTEEEAEGGELKVVFENGNLINPTDLATIRERLLNN